MAGYVNHKTRAKATTDTVSITKACACHCFSWAWPACAARREARCRAEIFACWARNGTSDMYYNTNAGLKPLVVSDEILHEALDVMSGEFTSVHDQNFMAPSC